MKTETLSTSMTFFWKFIFSIIWLIGMGAGSIVAIMKVGIQALPSLIVYVVGITILYYGCIRAKNVYLDDNYLYVGNFLKKIKIPLHQVKKVEENVFIVPRPIFIEFKVETEFGKKIMFLGYTELFLFCSTHPAVKKLKNRI